MSIAEVFITNPVTFDLFQLVTGKGNLLGYGISRDVYSYGTDNKFVIKFEKEGNFQNVNEWEVWNRVKDTEWSKWFAPVENISPCGRILIQARTRPFASDRQIPKKIPAFFTDVKTDNWGMLKGHPVCHDFGYHLLMEKGMSNKMKSNSFCYNCCFRCAR